MLAGSCTTALYSYTQRGWTKSTVHTAPAWSSLHLPAAVGAGARWLAAVRQQAAARSNLSFLWLPFVCRRCRKRCTCRCSGSTQLWQAAGRGGAAVCSPHPALDAAAPPLLVPSPLAAPAVTAPTARAVAAAVTVLPASAATAGVPPAVPAAAASAMPAAAPAPLTTVVPPPAPAATAAAAAPAAVPPPLVPLTTAFLAAAPLPLRAPIPVLLVSSCILPPL